MAFLDWFKNKRSKSPGSTPEVYKPAQVTASVTPKAAMQQAPHANATSNKAVMPKSIQPLNLSSRRATAPLGLKSTGPIRLDEALPVIKPSASAALNPESAVPEKHIQLELGDFIDKVPDEMLAAGGVNRSEKISISSKQFASDLSRGKVSIPLATLQGIKPEIFTAEAASSDISIPLPLHKIVPQIGEFKLRDDQQSEERPDQNFETPFLKGAIRDGAEIPAQPAKPAAASPSTAESSSTPPLVPAIAPKANPLKASPPAISMPGGPLKVSPAKEDAPAQTKTPPQPLSTAPPAIKMPPLSPPAAPPEVKTDAPVSASPAMQKPAPRPLGGSTLPLVPSQGDGDVQIRRRPPATVRATVAGGKIRISGKPGSPSLAVNPPTAKTSLSGLPRPATPALSPLPAARPSVSEPVSSTSALGQAPAGFQPEVPEPKTSVPPANIAPVPITQATSTRAESEPSVSIPLTMIIDSIPGATVEGDLATAAMDTEVPVPLSLITPQLSRGSIKISIQALTGLLPEQLQRIFGDSPPEEEIPLPLQYVLSHLPASAFAQRADQIDERPSEEISTPFSQKAKEDAERLEYDEASQAEPAGQPEASDEEPESSAEEPQEEPDEAPAPEAEPVVESQAETVTDESTESNESISEQEDTLAEDEAPEPEQVSEPASEVEPPFETDEESGPEEAEAEEPKAETPSPLSLPGSIFAPSSPDVRGRHIKPFISRRALRTIDSAEDAPPKPLAPVSPQPLAPASGGGGKAPETPEKVEAPVPKVAPRASSAEGLVQLQEIFMTDDALDARTVAKLCATLPGVAAAVFSTRDGLHLAGGIDGLSSVSALCALVPQAYDKSAKFSKDATLGHATSFTIATDGELFSIFGETDVFVVVKHDGRELKPGIRAKLQGVANGLSSIYAPSTGTGH